MFEVEDRVEWPMHEGVEDLYEEEGEHDDAAEVVEHHLVVQVLADAHRLEVDQGVDRGEKVETVADVLEQDPCVTAQEEPEELGSPQNAHMMKREAPNTKPG